MVSLRLAIRTLLGMPGVTGVAIVSLALGIGANTAIFSLFNQLLSRPLPVVAPERLVNLEAPGPKPGSDSCNQAGGCDEVFSYPMFRDLQASQTVFTDIAAHRTFGLNIAYGGQTWSGEGVQISGSYFPTLGLDPEIGRLFDAEVDDPVGGHPVVVLSHDFWQTRLDADPHVVDASIVVNGMPMTVAGVAPAGFRGTTLGVRPMVFVPLTMRGRLASGLDSFDDRRSYWLYLFARLAPGVSIAQARAGLQPLYVSLLTDVEASLQIDMSEQTMAQFLSKPLLLQDGRRGQSSMDEEATVPLMLLFAVTAVVILISCANIASLLLARSVIRAPETAVRLSLGATRSHLFTQHLTESVLLGLAGGVAGLLVAEWTLRLIGAMLPPEGLEAIQLTLDPLAVTFTMSLSVATGVLFGIFPALHSTRSDFISALKDQAGQPAGARGASRFRAGLVMAQFALSMTLLVAAGLFIDSLRNVVRVDLGMETDNVVTFRLAPVLNGYEPPQTRALFDRVEAALAAQPGVSSVSAASVAVFSGSAWAYSVMVEGYDAGPDTDRVSRVNRIGSNYFRTLRIPLLAGRDFTASDALDAPRVAVVNESFARKFGLGRDAVGRRMGSGGLDAELDRTIVGLVADTKYNDVKNPNPPLFFSPYRQEPGIGSMTFYARTSIVPDGLLRAIPGLIADLDPNLPVDDLKTLPQQVRENIFLDRMMSILSAAFAVIATLLAALGLYGVLAYTVSQRTREIGLRMALGADTSRVRNMVVGQVTRLMAAGAAVGVVAALALARLAQSLLYEVEATNPVVILAALGALGLVGLATGLVPAQRASQIDPMTALRYK